MEHHRDPANPPPPLGAGPEEQTNNPMEVAPEDGQEEMLNVLSRRVPPAVVREATSLYECLLVSGATAGVAQRTVVELFSPPRVTNNDWAAAKYEPGSRLNI